jgi:hypothetical protein
MLLTKVLHSATQLLTETGPTRGGYKLVPKEKNGTRAK